MKKLKVVHIITRLIVGGAQENVIMIINSLKELDKYDLTLISGPGLGPEGNLYDEIKKRKIKFKLVPELRREISPILDLISLIKLYSHLKKEKFDIVHTHSSKAGILGRIAAKLTNVPLILHCIQGWEFHQYTNKFMTKIYITLEKFISRFTDYLLPVSKQTMIDGLEAGIGSYNKYEIIHNFVELEKYDNNSDSKQAKKELNIANHTPIIGAIMRLVPQKNPLDIIKIAEKVKTNHSNVKFIIIGDGPLLPDLNNLIQRKKLSNNIILTRIKRNIPELLKAMDIFILTSLWEGLPLVFLQAMASGKPIIAYNVGGTSEAVNNEENGYLVKPGDTDTMVKRINELIKDKTRRIEMGIKGRRKLEQEFNKQKQIQKIIEIYDTLVPLEIGQDISS